MQRSAWLRTREILEAVLDAPEGSRTRLLDELCETGEQRREVEELLALDRGSAELLMPPREGGARELLGALEARGMVGERVGAYRIDGLVATGGMGDVYRASRVEGAAGASADRVAVKVIRGGVMSDAARTRFARERRLLSRLSHPNIARLLDAGDHEGRAYLVLEYVDGTPLKAYCDGRGLDVRARVALIATICEAVAHAHQNLIVHRDLKPANVLVTEAGEPKLLDFGISKLIGDASETPGVTVTRALTPRYASPEQLLGRAVTTASDVYSIGVILHETLTGRLPEVGKAEADSRLDLELRAILQQSLAFDARERYPSAEAMGTDLRRYLAGERVTAYAASRAYRARKWARRHRVLVASALVALLLIIGGGATGIVMASRLAVEKAQTDAAKNDADRVNRFLTETLQIASGEAGRGNLSWRGMLDDAGERLGRAEFSPRVEGELHLTLGRSYRTMGRIDDAGRHLERAVAKLVEGYGDEHLLVAEARESLADYLKEMGEFDAAIAELERAQAVRRSQLGPSHVSVGVNAEAQGMTEMIRRRFDAAERRMLEAKSIFERGGHEGHLARILDELGMLSMFRGRLEEAALYRREALSVQERRRGAESFESALARTRLGEVHASMGEHDEAARLVRESLATVERLAPGGLGSSYYHSTLAGVLARGGDPRGADEHYLHAIRILEGNLPGSRHDWLYAREQYARFLISEDRPGTALLHMREVAEAYEDMLGPEHLRTRIARDMAAKLGERVSLRGDG